MSKKAAIIGVDYGEKGVGVSLCEPGSIVQRFRTIRRAEGGDAALLAQLLEIACDAAAETIVVGVPRNLDGELTAQSEVVLAFVEQLRVAGGAAVDVVTVDETLSSVEAQRRLQEEGVPLTEEHAEAAKIILEDYLRQNPQT